MLHGSAMLGPSQPDTHARCTPSLSIYLSQVGGKVLIVNGSHRGAEGQLLSINVDAFSTSIKIQGGMHGGRVVEGIEYEDVCKLAPAST